jgi:hypothetical protein
VEEEEEVVQEVEEVLLEVEEVAKIVLKVIEERDYQATKFN